MGNKKSYEVGSPPDVQHLGLYCEKMDNPMKDLEKGKEIQQGNTNQGVETVDVGFEREDSQVELRRSFESGDKTGGNDGMVCDVGSWHPRRLKWIVGGPKAFAFWTMLYLMFKASSGVYFGSVLPTLEKQFGLSSTEAGTITIINDAMETALIIFVTYFGQRSHRPRVIGIAILLVGIGITMNGFPHYLLDPYTNIPAGCNDTIVDYCADELEKEDPCGIEFEKPKVNPVWWLIVAQVLLGVGNVAIKPLGTTYIDDAVGRHTTPLYLAFLFIGPTLGAIVGFFTASGVLSVFVDFDRVPVEDRPPIDDDDSRFIGAWWVGFLFIGCGIMASSVPFFFFPRYLPITEERAQEEEAKLALANGDVGAQMKAVTGEDKATDDGKEVDDSSDVVEKPTVCEGVTRYKLILLDVFKIIKEMVLKYKNMLTNGALLFICFETAMAAAALAGEANFQIKYLDLAFDATPSETSMMAVIVIPFAMAGTMIGGIIMRRRKWSPFKCALLLIFGDAVGILILPFFLTLSCKTLPVAGVSTQYVPAPTYDTLPVTSGPIILMDSVEQARSPCNLGCSCRTEEYKPVCGSDGLTYVSPCYAGCEVVEFSKDDMNRPIANFSDCRCISPGGVNTTATDGECPADCHSFHLPLLIAVYVISNFCTGLGRTALVLILLRIVDDDMRASALGFQGLITNVFGFLTAPIYFGALFTNACLLWNYKGDDRGACSVYDLRTTRLSFYGVLGSFRVVGIFMMSGVLFFLRDKEKNFKDKSVERNKEAIST